MRLESGPVEHQADPEGDQDRGHDQAGHGEVEHHGGAAKRLSEREAGGQREHHGQPHDHARQGERTCERPLEIPDHLRLEELPEPVQRHAVHREGESAVDPLERQDDNRDDGSVHEHHEQREEEREGRGTRPSALRPGARHSSLRTSTIRISAATIISTTASRMTASAAAAGVLEQRPLVVHSRPPTDALWPPDIICTVTKSPITSVTTKIVPIAMPGLHRGRITCRTVRQVPAPAS